MPLSGAGQTAIAIRPAADDQTPYLSDSDLDTLVNLELDLLVSGEQAGKMRDDNGLQTVLSQFPTIF